MTTARRWSRLTTPTIRVGSHIVLLWLMLLCVLRAYAADGGDAAIQTLFRATDAYRLTELRQLLAPLAQDANRAYFEGKIAIAEYRHIDADQLSMRCVQLARSDAERSRCAEVGAEAIALAIALSGDDLARLRMINTLRARLADAVRFDPKNLRAVQLSARFYRIAPWWLGGGARDALAMIARAAVLAPARADELRGIDAFDARQWPDAVRYLQRVSDRDRDGSRANARYYLALAYEKAGERKRAIKVLTELVASHAEFWDAQFQLGTMCLDDDPTLAAKVLTRFSAAATPGAKRLANSWWRIGVAEEKQGHAEAALRAYRTALRYKPGHNESLVAAQRLSPHAAGS